MIELAAKLKKNEKLERPEKRTTSPLTSRSENKSSSIISVSTRTTKNGNSNEDSKLEAAILTRRGIIEMLPTSLEGSLERRTTKIVAETEMKKMTTKTDDEIDETAVIAEIATLS